MPKTRSHSLFTHARLALLAALQLVLVGQVAATGAGSQLTAFPGAVGFGSQAAGGRGGAVYHVTTLADAGPGSLRDGVESVGSASPADGEPLTVVFEVGGTIALQSPLTVRRSLLTIAGQTAPGGIGLSGYPVQIADVSDVVVRYLRVRTSDANAQGIPGKPGQGNADLSGDAGDAISVFSSERVVLDHVSASWGMDETLSVTGSKNITVQHSIIAESLNRSFHPEGDHGYGSLVRGEGREGYTFFGNLWAHHFLRSPAIGGQQNLPPDVTNTGLDIDIVNNVIYDWGLLPSHNVEDVGLLRVHYSHNTLVAGVGSFCGPCAFIYVDAVPEDDLQIFQEANLQDINVNGAFDPEPVPPLSFTGGPIQLVEEPFSFSRADLEPLSADRAYDRVVREAGASLVRDEVDRRLIRQLVEQTGGVIDSQEDVGGVPQDAPPREAPEDVDRDGMADEWECRRGLDPDDPRDRNRRTLSWPRTNLEVYLAELVDPDTLPRTNWWRLRRGRWVHPEARPSWLAWLFGYRDDRDPGRCDSLLN